MSYTQLIMGAWVKYLILLAWLFFPGLTYAQADKDWVEAFDPRPFVPKCSFEKAKEISFEEVSLKTENHIGECVKIFGYYSGAYYDRIGYFYNGVEGYIATNGDKWFGVAPEVFLKNRIGIYLGGNIEPYFLEHPKTSKQFMNQMDYWDEKESINDHNIRNLNLVGTVYSCENWERDLEAQGQGKSIYFVGFCHFGQGAIIVVSDWLEHEGQVYDPVLELAPDLFNEYWELKGQDQFQNSKTCKFENAILVEFRDLVLHPARVLNQCVRVKGFSNGIRYYYDGIGGLYKTYKEGFDTLHPFQIGLYLMGDMGTKNSRWYKEAFVSEIVGWVGTCEHEGSSVMGRSDRNTEGQEKTLGPDAEISLLFSMFGGYCHYDGGTYIVVTEAKEEPGTNFQITGEENREEFGNLYYAPMDWENEKEVTEAVETWLEKALSSHTQTPENPETSPLERYLDMASSGGGELRKEIFLEKGSTYYPEDWGGNVCFCLEDDCSKTWPISVLDVYYSSELPFMCIFFNFDGEKLDVKRQWKK